MNPVHNFAAHESDEIHPSSNADPGKTGFPITTPQLQRWAMGWMIGVLGFDSRWGLGIFLFTTASRTALGPTQPI
jgi:hypothetical protein